jgi:SH3-like domain-containing protein
MWVRKTAFHTAWIALLFSLITGLNAASLHNRDTLRNEAIITQGVVNAKSSPDRSGTDLFTLHEGTKVTIRETIGEWVNVHVGSNEGWIRNSNLERI